MKEHLKKMVFETIEEHLSLKDFESWLYQQDDLVNQLNDDLIFALFTFNYKQNGAKYEFKKSALEFFDKEEFMLWKVKTNLQDLINETESRDRILNEFYYLGYDELPFLHELGYYAFQLEDAEYLNFDRESIIQEMKNVALDILHEIKEAENKVTDFKISTFKRSPIPKVKAEVFNSKIEKALSSKKWWQFWK
jgi:hypothetical protein